MYSLCGIQISIPHILYCYVGIYKMGRKTLGNRTDITTFSGLGGSVVIVTGYEVDGTGIESRKGEIFRTCPDQPWGPPSLLYNGYRVFPWGRKRPGRDANASPLSSA
jgi:hypothetical protein